MGGIYKASGEDKGDDDNETLGEDWMRSVETRGQPLRVYDSLERYTLREVARNELRLGGGADLGEIISLA